MTDEEIQRIEDLYTEAFGCAPSPFGIDLEDRASVMAEYLARGEPIPVDYDWYPDLPPGAMV